MNHRWTYPCRVKRVVDGDTVDVVVDLGFYMQAHVRVRLEDVDTAEVYGVSHESAEYELGMEQSTFVDEWTAVSGEFPLVLRSKSTGKYGRWLGDLYCWERDQWLTDALVEAYPDVENVR